MSRSAGVFLAVLALAHGWQVLADPVVPDVVKPSQSRPLSEFEVMSLAAGADPDLLASQKELDLRRSAWKLQLRGLFPAVTLSFGNDERLARYGSDSFTKSLSVQLSQPLYPGGTFFHDRDATLLQIELDQLTLDRQRMTVASGALQSYRAVVRSRARALIMEESLATARLQRDLVAREAAMGLATADSVAEADLSLGELTLALELERLQAELAADELAVALGLDSLPPLTESLDPSTPPVTLEPDTVVSLALDRSADLRIAVLQLRLARSTLVATRWSWLPALTLEATGRVGGERLPFVDASWNVGIRVSSASGLMGGSSSVTLGGNGRYETTAATRATVEPLPDPAALVSPAAARVAYERATSARTLLAGRVEHQARAACRSYLAAYKKRDLAHESLRIAESSLSLARTRADLGQIRQIDVMELVSGRGSRQLALVDAMAAAAEAGFAIERMLDLAPGTLAGLEVLP